MTEILVAAIAAVATVAAVFVGLIRVNPPATDTLKTVIEARSNLLSQAASPTSKQDLERIDRSISLLSAKLENDVLRTTVYRRSLLNALLTSLMGGASLMLITIGISRLLYGIAYPFHLATAVFGVVTLAAGGGLLYGAMSMWDGSVERKVLKTRPAGSDFTKTFVDLPEYTPFENPIEDANGGHVPDSDPNGVTGNTQ